MTGTNVFIRGTTQFRADARNFVYFIFISSATSFDTLVDFSAPPLSVKCLTQNTSDEPILSPFKRKINNFSHPKVRLAGREILCPPDSWRIFLKGTGRHLDDFHSEWPLPWPAHPGP